MAGAQAGQTHAAERSALAPAHAVERHQQCPGCGTGGQAERPVRRPRTATTPARPPATTQTRARRAAETRHAHRGRRAEHGDGRRHAVQSSQRDQDRADGETGASTQASVTPAGWEGRRAISDQTKNRRRNLSDSSSAVTGTHPGAAPPPARRRRPPARARPPRRRAARAVATPGGCGSVGDRLRSPHPARIRCR